MDLSSPTDVSVNDGIQKELCCSLSYTSVDAVAEKILALGKGALIAQMDIKQAYRMVPVNPADRWLLGMRWDGSFRRQNPPFRTEVGSTHLFSSSRCTGLDYEAERRVLRGPLHRRLCNPWCSVVHTMCNKLADHDRHMRGHWHSDRTG